MRQHGLSSRSPRYRLGSPMSSTVSLTCRRPVCTSFSPGTGRPTGNRTSPHSSRPPPNAYPRPARTRMRRQGCCRSVRWLPGFLPAITQGCRHHGAGIPGAAPPRVPVTLTGRRSWCRGAEARPSPGRHAPKELLDLQKQHPVSKRRRSLPQPKATPSHPAGPRPEPAPAARTPRRSGTARASPPCSASRDGRGSARLLLRQASQTKPPRASGRRP